MVLDTSLLNTQQYKVCTKGKVSNPGKEVAPSPTPWCSSYWKGSLLVANLTYTYTEYLWYVNEYSVGNILNKLELIYLHSVKWFQLLLCKTNNSIYHQSFICTQLNGLFYLINRWGNSRFYNSWSNGSEGVFYIPPSSICETYIECP